MDGTQQQITQHRVRIGPADVRVFEDGAALAAGAAAMIASLIRREVTKARAAGGRLVSVAMAGGSTPVATYRRLATMDIPWSGVCAWVGDERYVPPDHEDSNGAMIGRMLMDRAGARFLRVRWAADRSAPEAAALYEADLLASMGGDSRGPRPDLILAGMGGDGHTLSLFPGSDALDVTDRWYVATEVAAAQPWRLTATYPLAHRAAAVYVLVSGESKAAVLAEVLQPTGDRPLPARRLMEGAAPVSWLVDRDAAAGLDLP